MHFRLSCWIKCESSCMNCILGSIQTSSKIFFLTFLIFTYKKKKVLSNRLKWLTDRQFMDIFPYFWQNATFSFKTGSGASRICWQHSIVHNDPLYWSTRNCVVYLWLVEVGPGLSEPVPRIWDHLGQDPEPSYPCLTQTKYFLNKFVVFTQWLAQLSI